MRRMLASELKRRLDAGQQHKLRHAVRRVFQDKETRLFDDELIRFARSYCKDLPRFDKCVAYLRNLRNESGRYFCRSSGRVKDVYDVLHHFQGSEAANFTWNANYQKALAKVTARYSVAKLSVLQFNCEQDIVEAVSEWDSALGWESIEFPDFNKKRDLLGQAYSYWNKTEKEAVENKSFNKPILLATRTYGLQAFDGDGKPTGSWKSKLRPVEMVNTADAISATRFTNPLNSFLRFYPYTAIGKAPSDISRWVNNLRYFHGNTWYSVDYSKYDSSIPSWLLHDAFKVVASAFERMSEYDRKVLMTLERDFIHKNIIVDEKAGHVMYVTHGTASGSKFTSIINGICNEIITETWSAALSIPVAGYMIMGDDNLGFVPNNRLLDMDRVASYIKHNFGVSVNAEKSSMGTSKENPEFLSKRWTSRGPWRPFEDIVMHMGYPERFRNYRVGVLHPWMLFLAYSLDCPMVMKECFDMTRFHRDFDGAENSVPMSKKVLDQLPWVLRQHLETVRLRREIEKQERQSCKAQLYSSCEMSGPPSNQS